MKKLLAGVCVFTVLSTVLSFYAGRRFERRNEWTILLTAFRKGYDVAITQKTKEIQDRYNQQLKDQEMSLGYPIDVATIRCRTDGHVGITGLHVYGLTTGITLTDSLWPPGSCPDNTDRML